MRASELAVVIPTRDRWGILERTLEALAGQTAAGFETVVAVDGEDQTVPERLSDATVVRGPRGGPGAARNRGAEATDRPLLLFLGDDTVPTPGLVSLHLESHRLHPEPEVAVLGRVEWHPDVADDRLSRWLDWSGSQFEYAALGARPLDDVGYGRLYASNVSIKRAAFMDAGGFDPDFRTADYEDVDLGRRLHERGMRLRYEPAALAYHLHRYDWPAIERRYENRARAERVMAAKHDWFEPWFHRRITAYASQPQVSGAWTAIADRAPGHPRRLQAWTRERANRWYHQQLAPGFLRAWEETE